MLVVVKYYTSFHSSYNLYSMQCLYWLTVVHFTSHCDLLTIRISFKGMYLKVLNDESVNRLVFGWPVNGVLKLIFMNTT